ncbi:MAG: LemA family protein [Candidatus Woesebacteria bacterium GW2011_GWA1_33_30]|uniref:LemA family protein n=1 Tax=Candidatus Woesebacteria bacterium GW2011_GWA2_33_28 TaxID=1618561 RepID=A0A0G0A6W2_9BACT|nr:MAG: LemA family protein [Candidatus Woesebacteria bacterium GW2011_GWA2_33_28]KKP47884.1 MAG: LemA family protein [Candidatus Woesebacteria bacterium GW2011_GWA1_33_30]KKP49326.1 MAG: LemA family protein [Microgenomates group bacterium GW2011_GWC1_33_32]KKP52037.1 MAG: LemA family protein [Candidatus Woesebacteria bacterium GW2011_GWB1_33_38]KKP57306.1 MAG: LemA family protein [Microgenomates group bacterium GW2011_GWD1_33_9]
MNFIYILLGLLVLVVFWIVSTYNFFVSSKTRIKASIQEIGNQLKRQADLIPNLEASVKGYLTHEKGILEMLSSARKLVSKGQDATKQISEVLSGLKIVVESNPELKANTVVENLMGELRDTSDKVMYSRRLLIDLTADYNVKRATVPTNLVANLFKFEELKGLETPESGDFLKVSSDEMKSIKVNL